MPGQSVGDQDGMSRIESFPPIVSQNSKVLILGSMPGVESLKRGEYYANQRNSFWRIMGELFGAGPSLPYAERAARVLSAGVGIWDSLSACTRPGSLDSSIKDGVANDFRTFFTTYPAITHVFFNGGTAEKTFRRCALPSLPNDHHVLKRLPSTSPAHAGMPLEAKLRAWSIVTSVLSPSAGES